MPRVGGALPAARSRPPSRPPHTPALAKSIFGANVVRGRSRVRAPHASRLVLLNKRVIVAVDHFRPQKPGSGCTSPRYAAISDRCASAETTRGPGLNS